MTWMNQAVHVARKDFTHARTALVVYAIIALIALGAALALPVQAEDTTLLTSAVIVLLVFGSILGASAVQADSPTQSNAFWASRPFHPTAMLGAKFLYCIVVIIGIPLVAEWSGLLHYQTSSATIAADLARSASVYALLLLATVVVASLTSDVRGFIVGVLAIVIGIALISLLGTALNVGGPQTSSFTARLFGTWTMFVVGLAGGLALLVWLYRRRDVSRVAWVGAVVVVGCLVWLLFVASASGEYAPPKESAVPTVVLNEARIVPSRVGAPPSFALRFAVPSSEPMRRVTISLREVTLRLHDGSTVKAEPMWEPMTLNDAASVLPAGVQSFDTVAHSRTIGTTVLLRDSDRARIAASGIASVDVLATVRVAEGKEIASTIFGTPKETSASGTRVQIGRERGISNSYAIEVLTASVENAGVLNPPTSVTVVNPETHEGLVLDSQRYGGSSSWMVLPGAPLYTARVSFNTLRPRESTSTIRAFGVGMTMEENDVVETNVSSQGERFPNSSWYVGSRIGVVQWKPYSSAEVHLTKAMQ